MNPGWYKYLSLDSFVSTDSGPAAKKKEEKCLNGGYFLFCSSMQIYWFQHAGLSRMKREKIV